MKKAYHHAVDGIPLNVVKNTSEHTGQLLVAIHPHPNQRLWMGNSATFVKRIQAVARSIKKWHSP